MIDSKSNIYCEHPTSLTMCMYSLSTNYGYATQLVVLFSVKKQYVRLLVLIPINYE